MSEKDMDAINSGDDSDHDIISTEMLHDICDGSQTHPNVNKREARYKIRDHIRQRKPEWKGALKATRSMGKGLHKVFSTFVKDIFARIDTFGRIWFRSFSLHSRTKKLCWIKKIIREHKEPWLNETLKEINILINNQTILIEDQNEGEPVTPCMDVYKAKIQSDGIIDKLKLRMVVRGDLQNE